MANKKFGMVIDLRRCTGCRACAVTCKSENEVPLGVWRSFVNEMDVGTYPKVKRHFLPRLCNHCDQPACVPVCPTGATYKREDGLVLITDSKCIGCGNCVKACPYQMRFLHPLRKTGANGNRVADKCTFCDHRLDNGLVPACVNTCIGRARIFGDLNDPDSEVSQVKAGGQAQQLRPQTGLSPEIWYIASDNRNVSTDKYDNPNI